MIVARSDSGTPPWTVLNAENPVPVLGNYEDQEFVVNNRVQMTHYQVALKAPSGALVAKSPSVNLLGTLPKSRYGAARYALRLEMLRMRGGSGKLMWHFQPLPGQFPGGFVNQTGQTIGVECPQDGLDGFAPPILTYVGLGSAQQTRIEDSSDGTGRVEEVTFSARMLAFPRPSRGHVLVDPYSDDRYAVGTVTEAYTMYGVVAVAYQTTIHLLNRDDERYRLGVPALQSVSVP